MTTTDQAFCTAVRNAADSRANTLLSSPPAVTHRELMRDAKVLISVAVETTDPASGPRLAAATLTRIAALRALQAPSGLFTGGDNVESPPDSAFTIGDACDAYAIATEHIDRADGCSGADLSAIRSTLAEIIRDATEPLLSGGVHTPNHRWELSAALGRIHRSFPDPRLLDRIEEWLAEGIDIDGDGLFSERSPNYAAHVSIPSLVLLSEVLDRQELSAVVVRNLEATLALIHRDGTVETIQSRRQDQGTRFRLRDYLAAYRLAAVCTGRADFAAAATRAARGGVTDPELLSELLLRPQLGAALPAASDDSERIDILPTIALAHRRSVHSETVVYGGSDYAAHGRIRSGLANDPTFLRLIGHRVALDSVRLSRAFFDVGPFRAQGLRQIDGSRFRLEETVEAAYYQPLDAHDRRTDGHYLLEDDGRFSASMSFSERKRDTVRMHTVIDAHLRESGVDLDVMIDAPALLWSLEFTFRAGGTVEGGVEEPDGTWILPTGRGAYRVDEEGISIEVDGSAASAHPLPYLPGQDYTALGGTDAPDGVRIRVGGSAPARFTVCLRLDRMVAQ